MTDSLEPADTCGWTELRRRLASSHRRVRGSAVDVSRSLVGAGSSRYERSIDRLLGPSGRVSSAAEGRAILASEAGSEAVVDGLQRSLVVTVPVVRRVARGARFTGVPWVLVVSTGFSSAVSVLTGARGLRVISSLVAHRIEETTGQPADPALVKKLAIELYLAPKRFSHLSDRRLRPGRLMRRWAVRGAFGRRNEKAVVKALEAAERLEMQPHLARWAEMDTSSARLHRRPGGSSTDGGWEYRQARWPAL